jgi:hypothetical protein
VCDEKYMLAQNKLNEDDIIREHAYIEKPYGFY